MASFVPFPDPIADAITDATAPFPALTIHPKPEPVDEDSLIAPPGMPTPPGMFMPPDMTGGLSGIDMPTPLAVQFPQIETPYLPLESRPAQIETPYLPRESRPGTSADGANVLAEYNRNTEMFNNAFSGEHHHENEVVLNNNARGIGPMAENSSDQVFFLDQVEHRPRSSELVRVMNLSGDDQVFYRGIVRKTRMLYDAIRIYSTADEEKRTACGFVERGRGDLKAATVMKNCGLFLYTDKKIVGAIPGIEIGDVFSFRMEMSVVGLHRQSQAGIDFLPASRSTNWAPIATSIVVSGGYEGNADRGNEIIYSGVGGQDKHLRQIAHQKLDGGNLALERSMHYGIEVRVIRGHEYEASASGKLYVYDGLYRVISYWPDVGMSGYRVYKYRLERLPNQPRMGSEDLLLSSRLRHTIFARTEGYYCLDISMGIENAPVTLFNNIDYDHEPLDHEYLVESVMPSYVDNPGSNSGCDCLDRCSRDCLCAKKNGGQFAYNDKGILIQGKPLIFECGSFCPCLPNCWNRVTQKGVRHKLEVFRTATGWGVRSLDYIKAGSFLCEYTGIVLTREQAHILSMGGDNLIYPRRFTEKWREWGDLSQVSPNYVCPSSPEIPPLDFAMDVSSLRNVASYIRHSTSPNLMVQFVLYDHNNMMFPRLMLFAMENIPPLRELSLDYGGVADESSPKLAICN